MWDISDVAIKVIHVKEKKKKKKTETTKLSCKVYIGFHSRRTHLFISLEMSCTFLVNLKLFGIIIFLTIT